MASPTAIASWQDRVYTAAHCHERKGGLAFDGTRLLYGHEHGATMLDVSNASAPVVQTDLATAWPVRHLYVPHPGRVIASATRAGLHHRRRGDAVCGLDRARHRRRSANLRRA